MAFLNEKISRDDRVNYGLDAIEKSVPKGVWHPSNQWTIDRASNVYLRQMWQSNEGPEPQANPTHIRRVYHLFVSGQLYRIEVLDDLTRAILSKEARACHVFLEVIDVRPAQSLEEKHKLINLFYSIFKERKGGLDFSKWVLEYQLTLAVDGKEICNV